MKRCEGYHIVGEGVKRGEGYRTVGEGVKRGEGYHTVVAGHAGGFWGNACRRQGKEGESACHQWRENACCRQGKEVESARVPKHTHTHTRTHTHARTGNVHCIRLVTRCGRYGKNQKTRVSADLQKFKQAGALLSSERQIASPIATFEQGLFERERERGIRCTHPSLSRHLVKHTELLPVEDSRLNCRLMSAPKKSYNCDDGRYTSENNERYPRV